MTTPESPEIPVGPPGFDKHSALSRAAALGLAFSEEVRAGVEANLALLAQHHATVLVGLDPDTGGGS